MNGITIIKSNGGVAKSLPGEDHYSGLMMYLANANLPSGFSTTDRIKVISTVAAAEALGITSDSANLEIKMLHYHLSECFRVNPSIVLHVGLFLTPVSTYDFVEIKTMQNYAEGKLRQIAVWCREKALVSGELTTLQGIATTLDSEFNPIQILYIPKIAAISGLSTTMVSTGLRNVSVVIGQDGDGLGNTLFTDVANSSDWSVGLAGLAIGILALSKVHESIAWVEAFPSGISTPAFSDGTLYKNCDAAVIAALDAKHYLFLRTQGGMSGSWFNDSYTMDLNTSDYTYIEANRSMDKAIRGIRTYLVPKLSGPIYLDPSTGQLNPDDVAYLEVIAGKQLEDMQKNKELSGYKVTIDPTQNVLSTSEIEFVVQKVGVGVMRSFKVTIKNTTQIS